MTFPVLSTDELRRCAERLPRIPLAHLPTPFEELPRFARRIGEVRVFVKRDDCTGLLFGGNKTRHNEFLLADALEQGADLLIWGAGVQ
jgi:L-cysteate sulfo-lyase